MRIFEVANRQQLRIIFSLIFQVILSTKTRLLQSIDQRRMGKRGYHHNPFWGPGRTLRLFFSHVRYLYLFFIIFFSQTLKLFTLLDTDQTRSNSVNRFRLMAN